MLTYRIDMLSYQFVINLQIAVLPPVLLVPKSPWKRKIYLKLFHPKSENKSASFQSYPQRMRLKDDSRELIQALSWQYCPEAVNLFLSLSKPFSILF